MDEQLITSMSDGYCEEPIDIENELDRFRQQWKQEISSSKPRGSKGRATTGDAREPHLQGEEDEEEMPSIEDQAKYLFMQGVNSEQNGRLYEAIKYYRRAVQLVPDIEFRIEELRKPKERPRQESESSVGGSDIGDEEDIDLEDLILHLSKMTADDATLCEPEFESSATHIGILPVEVLITIMRWVISKELDILALERMALVCRGFYLCARDHTLWRHICQKIWGSNCGRPTNYGTYRDMYILRPHVLFLGVYISKTTYYRPGEKGMDNYYKPMHVVDYYRIIRFFPDGQVLILTTPEEPALVVSKLKNQWTRGSGIQYGYFKIAGDLITAVVRRKKNKEPTIYKYKRQQRNREEAADQSFHMEFELQNSRSRRNALLVWKHYSVQTIYKSTGNETTSEFEITSKAYPPLVFSKVKSYAASTDSILE